MQVAYFITSFRSPAQLVRLVGTLRRAQPDAPVVIHRDRFRSDWNEDLVTSFGDVHVFTSDSPISWGDFCIVDVTWQGLTWMVDNVGFDWVVCLSEQDYPIAPLERLEDYLATCGVDALIEASPIRDLDPDLHMDCDRRYNYRFVQLPRLGLMARLPAPIRRFVIDKAHYVNFLLYKLQKRVTFYRYPDGLPMRLGLRARRSPFSPTFPCWYGTQWIVLSRRAAGVVVDFVKDRDDYRRYYERTAQPIESATATIVCNDPSLRVRDETLHFVRFTSDDGHPDVLGLDDLDDLVNSDRFFARKFDIQVDSSVLDALDRHVFTSKARDAG